MIGRPNVWTKSRTGANHLNRLRRLGGVKCSRTGGYAPENPAQLRCSYNENRSRQVDIRLSSTCLSVSLTSALLGGNRNEKRTDLGVKFSQSPCCAYTAWISSRAGTREPSGRHSQMISLSTSCSMLKAAISGDHLAELPLRRDRGVRP